MTRVNSAAGSQAREAAALLAWYDRHRRRLPWRAEAGEVADPYRVWLSEIMLQQTTVAAVQKSFRRFTTLWPTHGPPIRDTSLAIQRYRRHREERLDQIRRHLAADPGATATSRSTPRCHCRAGGGWAKGGAPCDIFWRCSK